MDKSLRNKILFILGFFAIISILFIRYIYSLSDPIYISNGSNKIYMGDTIKEIDFNLGNPHKTYQDISGNYWNIYGDSNNIYKNYIKIKSKNNRAVGFETCSQNWSLDGNFTPGSSFEKSKFNKLKKSYKKKGYNLRFLFDTENKVINFISLEKSSKNTNTKDTKINYTYLRDHELQIYDYLNIMQLRNNKEALIRSELLNDLAKNNNMYRIVNNGDRRTLDEKTRLLKLKSSEYSIGKSMIQEFDKIDSSAYMANEIINMLTHYKIINVRDYNYIGISSDLDPNKGILYTTCQMAEIYKNE